MKKLILLGFAMFSLALPAKADMLMTFPGDLGVWNSEGVQVYTCMPDNSCVGLDSSITTRSSLGLPNYQASSLAQPATTVPQPIIAPMTNPSLSSGSGLSAPYTENQLRSMSGIVSNSFGTKIYGLPATCFAVSPTSARCDGSGPISDKVKINYNGQIVWDGSLPYGGVPTLKTDTGTTILDTLTNLTPDTTYSYQVIYSEAGRQDTVLNETFVTPK